MIRKGRRREPAKRVGWSFPPQPPLPLEREREKGPAWCEISEGFSRVPKGKKAPRACEGRGGRYDSCGRRFEKKRAWARIAVEDKRRSRSTRSRERKKRRGRRTQRLKGEWRSEGTYAINVATMTAVADCLVPRVQRIAFTALSLPFRARRMCRWRLCARFSVVR